MKLKEVTLQDEQAKRAFLELPLRIYANDPNWIRPLDQDIESVFDPAKNKFWRHGKAIRWLLEDDKCTVIGRVAAFINDRTARTDRQQPTGGMGFFECIDDQNAANFLFDTCRDWLKENGMEAMDGPINFGEREAWWGLLAEGRHAPVYQMNYQPAYYLPLFENYGFQVYFKQYVLYRRVMDPVPEKFERGYAALMRDPNYNFKHIDKKQLRKFAADFRHIYNEAWGGHDNFKKMREDQSFTLMKKLKPILAPELAWFGYYKDEPVAFFIMIPDLNQVIKNFNGKFGIWEKLKVWWTLKRRKTTVCYGIVFGVVPKHQGKGADAGLIKAASLVLHPMNTWDHMEMTWIGDFNPKMLKVAQDAGGEIYKTYYTMRYLFDRNKPFERLPIMRSHRGEEAAAKAETESTEN